MSFPMLTTRVTVPPLRSGLVDRPRLIAELQASFERGVRLILISAPAGSGKSTLAGAWVRTAQAAPGLRFAWLSLDPADNEALRFWSGLIGALQVALPEIGHAEQRMLAFSETPPLEAVLTGLLNQIGARSERIVVILDDYHLITEPSIHDGLSFLLEHLPANLQVALCTRADPPLPLNRLRVRAQLLEVRAADLFFTPPESERLINGVMGLGLSAGDLAALDERTEGWAAGVQLAAVLLMDERRKPADGAAAERLSALVTRLSGRHHLIADYLLDEVLSRQTEAVQRFLLESSILDAFCAPLCAALLGEDPAQAQAVLETLDRGNLFLIPLDEEKTWFRYHHLFADALRIRLERTQPDASAELHRRASRWFEENGLAEASIDHALAACDYDRAAGLLEGNAGEFARQGRYATLLRRVGQIPAEIVSAHPRLAVWGGRARVLSGDLSAAEAQLQHLERVGEPAGLTGELRGQIAAVRATAAVLNADVAAAKAQAQLALDLLPPSDPTRAAVLLSFGDAAMMSGEFPLGIRLFGEAVELCRQHNDLSNLLTASAHLAEGFWM
ncbi:MAG TPA: hypothetical protein VFF68_07855, partial [Anaerolineaceae bacterium]|nr:hypothetical protein [Anaerolineaceae bacterium]